MIPDDPELRRALAARSGEPASDFSARVRNALEAGTPTTSWMPAVAAVVVVALCLGTIGALVYLRRNGAAGVASGARMTTPSPRPTDGPVILPGEAEFSAGSNGVVWLLVNYDHLYSSTDEGGHWDRRTLPADPGVRPHISFIDAREGWLLAPGSPTTQCQEAPAAVWHTADGGESWTRLPSRGLDGAQCKEVIYFADPRHGFVGAGDELHAPTVYATSDGGASWRAATIPDGPLFKTQGGGFTLRVDWIRTFGSSVYLEATGAQDDSTWRTRTFVYTSTDGGTTWQWRQKLASASTAMVTESRWLQYAPDVEETVNGGQQFHPYTTDLFSLSPVLGGTKMVFADARVGYATGRGQLARTTDGGAHWAIIPTPGS